MSCAQLRKYLYAFADGQLDVKDNCEVLDHLKMCSECSRVVADHQDVRAALRRSCEQVRIPPDLEARVRGALAAGGPVKHAGRSPRFVRVHPDGPVAQASRLRLHRRRGGATEVLGRTFSFRTLAAAACIGLIVLAARQFGAFDRLGSAPPETFTRIARGYDAALIVADVHKRCCAHHDSHHHKDLPRDLDKLATAITAHFGSKFVAMAPDLTRYGFGFESANFCGVGKRKGCENGGHLLYVSADHSTRFSFFSVPRRNKLNEDGCQHSRDDDWCKYAIEQADGSELYVVAWHEDATSYICCGKIEADRIIDMARQVRIALNANPAVRTPLASFWNYP